MNVNLPAPGSAYDMINEANTRRAIEQAIAQAGSGSATIVEDMIDPTDPLYGAKGDNVADDTAALNAAFVAAAAASKIVNGKSHKFKITADVNSQGCPGIIFDAVANSAGPGIYPTGNSGYTSGALIITGEPIAVYVGVYGTGNTLGGKPPLYFNNPQKAVIGSVRVYDFASSGVQIDRCFDCVFVTISVELCGTASLYALSLNDGGDTCNMSHFLRIQVEQANVLAIRISGNTLSCVFDSIHSERAVVVGSGAPTSATTWDFGGGNCTYNNIRCTAVASGTSGYVWVRGANCVYQSLRVESSLNAVFAGDNTSSITLIEANLTGANSEQSGNGGNIIFVGGNQATIAANWTGTSAHRTFIGPSAAPVSYTEGTFTPLLLFGGNATGMTYSAQSGTWTRIGNTMYFTLDFTLSAKGSSTGVAVVSGLPYTSQETSAVDTAFYASITGMSGLAMTARIDAGTTFIVLAWANADAAPSQLTNTVFANTSRLILSGSVRVV